MKRYFLLFCLLFFGSFSALPQTLGGYPIIDWLVTATHPNGCNSSHVTGPPDNTTWVNQTGYSMSGTFGQSHTNTSGYDLLLEASYHGLDLEITLVLSGGQLSATYAAGFSQWTNVDYVLWQVLLPNCFPNMLNGPRYILPLDFETHFGLTSSQVVTGIQINFLPFGGPDFAGAYIIDDIPCPPVDLGPDISLCQGQTALLDATTPDATYLWSDGSTGPTFTAAQPGTYWVMVTKFCGVSIDTVHIFPGAPPVVDLGTDTILCQGQTLPLELNFANATYQWNNNSTGPSLVVSQPGLYWVIVTSACGTGSDSIVVDFEQPPIVNLGPDTSICTGEIITLIATFPGAAYLWSNGTNNQSVNVAMAGNYWVQVSNSCGTDRDTIEVSEIPFPEINLGGDRNFCEGESETITLNIPGATYLWHSNSAAPEHNITEPGQVWVSAVNACGTGSDTIMVAYAPKPYINIGADTALCPDQTIILNGFANGGTYLWQDHSTGENFEVLQPGTYWAQVTVNNCTSTDSITVILADCETPLEIPNVFTPNGDGLNDIFKPASTVGIEKARLTVFNRWGKEIYRTENIETGWDGSNCKEGIYFWSLDYTTIHQKQNTIKGFVSLFR